MSEKRFVLEISSFSGKHMKFLNILDNGKRLKSEDIVDLLNEQQSNIQELERKVKKYAKIGEEQLKQIIELQEENEQLRQQLKKKEEDERLYANEIVKLNKEAKEVLDFKSLGGDY